MTDEETYFLSNYGSCALPKCQCLAGVRFDGAWGGLACPDWVPFGARSYDELTAKMQEIADRMRSGYNDSSA